MNLIQNECGIKLYVWSKNKGSPSEPRLLISAHGDECRVNGMSRDGVPKDTVLNFYGKHGHTLADVGIASMIAGNIVPMESISPKKSNDYQLSKYQNSTATSYHHNEGGETYQNIREMQEWIAQCAKFAMTDLRGAKTRHADNFRKAGSVTMDICTIRNRKFLSEPTLSEVLQELWKKGYRYSEIHCSFCRGAGAKVFPKAVPEMY